MEALPLVSLNSHSVITCPSGLLETLTSCQANIEGCGTPLTESSSILDEVNGCKTAADNLIAGLICSIKSFSSLDLLFFLFIKNRTAELKYCSKRTPGFERCECLQNMDESNADRVKVKLKRNTKLLGWYKKGKNNQSLAKKYFFPVNICYQYSLHALAIREAFK